MRFKYYKIVKFVEEFKRIELYINSLIYINSYPMFLPNGTDFLI